MAAASGLANGYRWRYLSDIELGKDTYKEDFYTHILPLIRPEWKLESLTFHVFESGVTNTLVAFYPKEVDLSKLTSGDNVVLLRLNGEGTERIINRTDEIISMICLNQAGFCPPVYAQLKNGLCYGFSPGRRLEVHETTDDWVIMKDVAGLTARLHSLDIPSYFKEREHFLWLKINQLLANVPASFSDPDTQKSFIDSMGSTENLKAEIEWLKDVLSDCKSPKVLCHNDIHSGNIIYNESTGLMFLVDMEYSGPNYLAFDIANHFCEFAGIEKVDYGRYPGELVQKRWIKMYLEEVSKLRDGVSEPKISNEMIQEIYEDVRKLVLGCHLFWIVWSLFQAAHSTIDFDFMAYGILRFKEYLKRKAILLESEGALIDLLSSNIVA